MQSLGNILAFLAFINCRPDILRSLFPLQADFVAPAVPGGGLDVLPVLRVLLGRHDLHHDLPAGGEQDADLSGEEKNRLFHPMQWKKDVPQFNFYSPLAC